MLLVLIKNEINKILSRRKMILITFIMLILVSLFSYGQNYQYQNTISKYLKTTDQTENINWQTLQKPTAYISRFKCPFYTNL